MLNPGWIVGFAMLAIGGVLQVVLLTYADLVLLSTNMITAIMFNTFLAIKFLGEKFLWKYDLPAFILMAISAITIIFLGFPVQSVRRSIVPPDAAARSGRGALTPPIV